MGTDALEEIKKRRVVKMGVLRYNTNSGATYGSVFAKEEKKDE